MIINLIASPRNVSTALMYSISQHPDIFPIDEPFYACYLAESGKEHPDRELIINNRPADRESSYDAIRTAERNHSIVFLKNMAHHIREEDIDKKDRWNHCFLIRHPRLHIYSFSKVIHQPGLEDLGTPTQRKLYDTFLANGIQPHVMDANHLLENPEKELQRFCETMNIDFHKRMLSWPSGPKSYDGCWGAHWYRSTWDSTGFKPPRNPEKVDLPNHLQPLLDACMVDYQYLYDQIKR